MKSLYQMQLKAQEEEEYNKNIEIMEPITDIACTEEYELLSFNSVSLQDVSAEYSGEMFNYIFYGSGEISGSTTSAETEEYRYRFINKEGKGEYATILASDCYIIPVEADVTPYLKVVTYREIKKP